MEILRPTPYDSGGNWLLEETKNSTAKWTAAENKAFENALAVYDEDSPDRWQKVAAMIPGKTVSDVIEQYRELEADVSSIEAGLVPIPWYITPGRFTLDWTTNSGRVSGYDGFKPGYPVGNKRSPSGRPPEQERKKGVPWTEEEHKLFLMGLKKYGKGDWRNISRNFVISRTPTQVASHAQKYFIRQLSGGKDKRRASIHDITTVNLDDETSLENKSSITQERNSSSASSSSACLIGRNAFPWNQTENGTSMAFNNALGLHSYGQNLQGLFDNDSCLGAHNKVFQL